MSETIQIEFSTIKFSGDEATEAEEWILENGVGFDRELIPDMDEDDPGQTAMVNDLSSEEGRTVVDNIIEDEIQFVLECKEFDECSLVSYTIDWDRSYVC